MSTSSPVLDQDFIDQLGSVPWFSKCGHPVPTSFVSAWTQVANWAEVTHQLSDGTWAAVTEEAAGDLTEHLSQHYPRAYQGVWNHLVREARTALSPLVTTVCGNIAAKVGLPSDFTASVKWDVLNVVMEKSYAPGRKTLTFFTEVVWPVYEAGHLPCGWSGEWPDGGPVMF